MPRYRKTTKDTAPLPRRFIITTSEKATVRPKSVAVMGLIASEKKKKKMNSEKTVIKFG